jgi:hypothetical protein
MNMPRSPDYVGTWRPESPELGLFLLFIDESQQVGNTNIRKVKGRIEDRMGHSTFDGEFGGHFVQFLKTYDEESIRENGAAPHGVMYKGERFEGQKYKGTFTVINGTSKGVRQDWHGEFEMRPVAKVEEN